MRTRDGQIRAPLDSTRSGTQDPAERRTKRPAGVILAAIGSAAVLGASIYFATTRSSELPAACSVVAGGGSTAEAVQASSSLDGIADYIAEHGGQGNVVGAIQNTAGNEPIEQNPSVFGNTIMLGDIPHRYCNPANLGHLATAPPRIG